MYDLEKIFKDVEVVSFENRELKADSRCVLGHFCMYVAAKDPERFKLVAECIRPFTTPGTGAVVLRLCNPKLSVNQSLAAALQVTSLNDDGLFDMAKQALAAALNGTSALPKEEEKPKDEPPVSDQDSVQRPRRSRSIRKILRSGNDPWSTEL